METPDNENNTGEGLQQLTPELYWQLRRLASRYMRREREGHTYRPTELVNEALFRLANGSARFVDRNHFYSVCATQMRRILVEYARRRRYRMRGDKTNVELNDDDPALPSFQDDFDIVQLDEALQIFEKIEPNGAKAFELHYFGGLTLQEMAELTGVSEATVTRQLRLAKAWLLNQLVRTAG